MPPSERPHPSIHWCWSNHLLLLSLSRIMHIAFVCIWIADDRSRSTPFNNIILRLRLLLLSAYFSSSLRLSIMADLLRSSAYWSNWIAPFRHIQSDIDRSMVVAWRLCFAPSFASCVDHSGCSFFIIYIMMIVVVYELHIFLICCSCNAPPIYLLLPITIRNRLLSNDIINQYIVYGILQLFQRIGQLVLLLGQESRKSHPSRQPDRPLSHLSLNGMELRW